MDLFDLAAENRNKSNAPLAERMRPKNLDEFVGQSHIVGEGKYLNMFKYFPSPTIWLCPTNSSKFLGRILSANGALDLFLFSAARSNRSMVFPLLNLFQLFIERI